MESLPNSRFIKYLVKTDEADCYRVRYTVIGISDSEFVLFTATNHFL